MSTTQPNKLPEWNTGGANRTEPTTGEKVSGWVANAIAPSAKFNWLMHFAGEWIRWISERFVDGATNADLTIQTPVDEGGDLILAAGDIAVGTGGDTTIRAGAGDNEGGDLLVVGGTNAASDSTGARLQLNGSGTGGSINGGRFSLLGGSAASAGGGDGSDCSIAAGSCADTTAGTGGDLDVSAGSGYTPGQTTIEGGDAVAAINRPGGDLVVASGSGRGTGSADVILKASVAGTTGIAPNLPSEFLRADGAHERLTAAKTLVANGYSNGRGALGITSSATEPVTPAQGDIWHDSRNNVFRVWDGTRWAPWHTLAAQFTGPSQSNQNFTTTPTAFDDRGGVTMSKTFATGTLEIGDRFHILGMSEHGDAEGTERAIFSIQASIDNGSSYQNIAQSAVDKPTGGEHLCVEADVVYRTDAGLNEALTCIGRGWSDDLSPAYSVAMVATHITGFNHAANPLIFRLTANYLSGSPGAAKNWKADLFEIDFR